MTIDEAIQKANAGDVDTMVNLGDYYAQHDDYENALIWWRRAAEQGNLSAVHKAFLLDGMMLLASVKIHPDEADDKTFQEISRYAEILRQNTDVDIEPNFTDAKYDYAKSLYHRNEYGTLLSFIRDENQPRFLVIYALALFSFAPTLASGNDDASRYYQAACDMVQAILQSGYTPGNHHNEQLLFIQAVANYSTFIRVGLFDKPDVPASYHILASQTDKLTDSDAQAFLSQALSDYRVKKGLFGTSITYIG